MTDQQIDGFLHSPGAGFPEPLPGDITPDVIRAADERVYLLPREVRVIIHAIATRYIADHGYHKEHKDAGHHLTEARLTEGLLAGFCLWDSYLKACPRPCDLHEAARRLTERLKDLDARWLVCFEACEERSR